MEAIPKRGQTERLPEMFLFRSFNQQMHVIGAKQPLCPRFGMVSILEAEAVQEGKRVRYRIAQQAVEVLHEANKKPLEFTFLERLSIE